MSNAISDDDVRARLQALPEWRLEDKTIVREYTFGGFPEAVDFVTRLVAPAEAADHHPDLEIHYRRVIVRYSTHSEGGLTAKDFAGAAAADDAARPPAQ